MSSHFSEAEQPQNLTEAIEKAKQALHPTALGFRELPHRAKTQWAWEKDFPKLGTVVFSDVSWHHGVMNVAWHDGNTYSALDLVVQLQQEVWGLPPEKCTSPLDMAIVSDTGGRIIYAYRKDKGLTPDGWLGFLLGYGARSGILISRFLAVRPDLRSSGVGTALKRLQAAAALQTGHYAMEWTYDPMRATNAYLNFNKLGATVDRYLENKYGEMGSKLYGHVPSHRFIMHWQLTSPKLQQFLVHNESDRLTYSDIQNDPIVSLENLDFVLEALPNRVLISIPRDIDALMQDNAPLTLNMRSDLHQMLIKLIDSSYPMHVAEATTASDPAQLHLETVANPYQITHFVTHNTDHAYYVLTRKETVNVISAS